MKKEIKNQSLFNPFPRRSLIIKNGNRRYSRDFINRTSHKIISNSDMKPNDSSQISILIKSCCKKICTTCIPENIRIDQEKNQQINIDLLYAYDPVQIEVK
jgi:hypothetical protein